MYLSLRWWILDFECEVFLPTKEGVTIPYTTGTVGSLLCSLVLLLSEGGQLETVVEGIKDAEFVEPVKIYPAGHPARKE